jgi:hypothetical protein
MNPLYKALLFAVGSHVMRYGAEWLYWEKCTGLFVSIFSGGSPACQGLRTVVDTLTVSTINCATVLVTTAPRLLGA